MRHQAAAPCSVADVCPPHPPVVQKELPEDPTILFRGSVKATTPAPPLSVPTPSVQDSRFQYSRQSQAPTSHALLTPTSMDSPPTSPIAQPVYLAGPTAQPASASSLETGMLIQPAVQALFIWLSATASPYRQTTEVPRQSLNGGYHGR